MVRRWLVTALAPLCGCLPFAVPPTTASVGAVHGTATSALAGVHTDVGFSPLQLSPDQHQRVWDATVSGSYEHIGNRDVWGLAAAGGPVLYPWGADPDDTITRVLPQVVGRWTTDGFGVDARVVIERADFTNGKVEHSDLGGYARGEFAIGCYLEAGRQFDGVDEWTATIGLVLRLPAAVGLFVPQF